MGLQEANLPAELNDSSPRTAPFFEDRVPAHTRVFVSFEVRLKAIREFAEDLDV